MRISLADLRPRPEAYDLVFVPAAAAVARSRYQELWRRELGGDAAAVEIRVLAVARARDLAVKGAAALGFPLGYDAVSRSFVKERLWLSGELDGLDILIDGLVWLGDRLAWFPKPWLALPADPTVLLHYSE